jgi:fatty-acyl-CoA synthase
MQLVNPLDLARRVAAESFAFATVVRAGMLGLEPPSRLREIYRRTDAYGMSGAAIGISALRHGNKTALIDERGALSYNELDRRSNSVANALREQDYPDGVCIAILCRNHRWLIDSLFGAAKLGARTVFLNTDFAGPQLHDVCEREGVDVLIYDEEFAEIVGDYAPRHGSYLAWTDSPDSAQRTVEALIARGDPANPPKPANKQQLIMLTSGTTGTPKGAPRHFGFSMTIPGGLLSKIPYRSGQTIYIAPPMFHGWGLLNAVTALGLGTTIVTARRFKPDDVLAAVEAHRCQSLAVVPIMLSRIMALGEDRIQTYDLSELKILAVAGAALPGQLATAAMDVFGDIVYNLYGSTEVAFASIATPADMRAAPGCVGRTPYGTTVRILDAAGNEVPTGTTGRIFVANGAQFTGYAGGGGKEIVRGLMSSGDVGHFNDDRILFVDGRDDEMIVSGGENVFPREIEELLVKHAAVYEAAVIGVDDEEYGQRLEAYVVCKDGAVLDEDTAKAFVKENLARYKVPRAVVFLDELPHNPSGKVLKRELVARSALSDAVGADSDPA